MHQTYALEASIAIASQRCGTIRDAPRLVRHVLEMTGLMADAEFGRGLLQESYDNGLCQADGLVAMSKRIPRFCSSKET